MEKRLLVVMIFLFPLFCLGQLPGFTFIATNTNETCSGNACVNFAVSGSAPGASILYAVYESPNFTDPVTTTSATSYCGLTAGTYLIIATQSVNGQSSEQQQSIIVQDSIEALTYELSDRSDGCGATGTIVVDILTGNPAFYEIISEPQILPQQTSNELSGLTGGTYVVRVTDICGEAVVQTYTFQPQPFSLSAVSTPLVTSVDCDTSVISQAITTTSDLAYPLDISYLITLPDGTIIQNSLIDQAEGILPLSLTSDVLLNVGQTYSFAITISDNCGHIITQNNSINISASTATLVPVVTCDGTTAKVVMALQASVTDAPAAYNQPLPFTLTESPTHSFNMGSLPFGQYTVMALNECGVWQELHLTVGPPSPIQPVYSIQRGCAPGFASLYIGGTLGITAMELTDAPLVYASNLPIDLTPLLETKTLKIADIPTGDYVFHITDECGYEFTLPITIEGLSVSDNSEVIPNCGSFNIDLQYADNNTSPITFWLQRYDPVTGKWGHPASNNPYIPGTAITNQTGFSLANNAINYNLVFPSGHFRVVSYRVMFSTDQVERNCLNPIFEFDFFGIPDIENVFSFSCSSNLNDVIVEAVGMEPLVYRITTLNGGSMPINNGSSGYFTGLVPGIYNFQVEDVCHNIVNQLYDISEPYPLTIGGSGLCQNESAEITVPSFSFLNYSWHKDSSATVLSTSATLTIPQFSLLDLGTYYVHITASAPNSCLDITLEYVIDEIILIPFAGLDNEQSFCGSQGIIDLNSYLSVGFQQNGSWSAISPNVVIDGNTWNSDDVQSGDFMFRYSVSSECGPTDSAEVILHILPEPELPQPVASVQSCQNGNIDLTVMPISGATFLWNGPAGFVSTQQNPTIENANLSNSGIYSVQAFVGNCPSEIALVNVEVATLPELSIAFGCRQDRMIVDVESSSSDIMEFQWTGPDGFSASGENIDITGNSPGNYTVVGTNQQGCFTQSSELIQSTLCRISSGISPNDDGDNDNFDLSGFGEIEQVKIFNRYGRTVFEHAKYVDQWHGQDFNGNLLPSATYFYIVKPLNAEPKTGWVYLLRN